MRDFCGWIGVSPNAFYLCRRKVVVAPSQKPGTSRKSPPVLTSVSAGHIQNPGSFHIPRGTQSLNFEVWDAQGIPNANLHLHLMQRPAAVNMPGSLVPSEAMQSRSVAVNSTGTQVVPLQPGEDGTVGQFSMNGFAMPYLYSVPMLWAKSPIQLLVPRAVAVADGLDF
jgi:hypothetical protein